MYSLLGFSDAVPMTFCRRPSPVTSTSTIDEVNGSYNEGSRNDNTSITRFQKPNRILPKSNSGRCTCSNHITCSEGSTLRKSLDQSGDGEYKVVRRSILAFLAIDKGLHAELLGEAFNRHGERSLYSYQYQKSVNHTRIMLTIGQKVSADFPM